MGPAVKTRNRLLTDRDVAFCFEQVGEGARLAHLAHYVYGISRHALSSRLYAAKARGTTDGGHGQDPTGGGWTPAPPPPTTTEAALEYITRRGGLTARDVAGGVGVTTEWAGVLIRRLCRRGLVVRRRRLARRGRACIYDAVTN